MLLSLKKHLYLIFSLFFSFNAIAGTWVGVLLFRDAGTDHVHLLNLDANRFTDKVAPAYGQVMDIWTDPSPLAEEKGYYLNTIKQLDSASKSLFIYTEKTPTDILKTWQSFTKKYRKKRSLLGTNCARSTAKMIEEIFDLGLEEYIGCARITLCARVPNSWSPISLPEAIFEQIKYSLEQNDFPYHISTKKQRPMEILRDLIQLSLTIQKPHH